MVMQSSLFIILLFSQKLRLQFVEIILPLVKVVIESGCFRLHRLLFLIALDQIVLQVVDALIFNFIENSFVIKR